MNLKIVSKAGLLFLLSIMLTTVLNARCDTTDHQSVYFDLLSKRIDQVRPVNVDSALTIAGEMAQILEEKDDKCRTIELNKKYFQIYFYGKKDLSNSLKYINIAANLATNFYPKELAATSQAKARIFFFDGEKRNLDSALFYYQLGLQQSLKYNDPFDAHFHYTELSDIFMFLEDYDSAIKMIQHSLELVRQRPGDRMNYGFTLFKARNIFITAEAYDQYEEIEKEYALFSLSRQNKSAETHQLTTYQPEVYDLISYYRVQLDKLGEQGDLVKKITFSKLLAEALIQGEAYSEAINVLENGYALVDENEYFKAPFYFLFRKAFEGTNETAKTLYYTDLFYQSEKAILRSKNTESLNELRVKYETAEKEQQIALLEKEQILANRSQLFLITLLMGAFLVGILLFIAINKRNEYIKELTGKNLQINKMLKEKDFLIKEIHHRVKNNLQMISSLLQLQGRYIKDANAQDALSDGQSRVRSMAIIHQFLYTGNQLNKINLQSYVENLLSNLQHSYNQSQKSIQIKYDIDNIELDIADMVPLGLIINELIVNSFKYAFEGREKGIIQIAIKERQNQLKLLISDNGIGMDLDNTKSGFGTRLIQSFIKKLNAEHELISSPMNGTQIKINFQPSDKITEKTKQVA